MAPMSYSMERQLPLVKKNPKTYYYLPPGNTIRMGKRPDGVPEFMFLKYTSDKGGEDKDGGLIHFLMEWGFTPKQESELKERLKQEHGGTLKGPVELVRDENGSFEIISATLKNKAMAPVLISSGKASPLPGNKVAVAGSLNKKGAQLLAATFEKKQPITDISVAYNFSYSLLAPAARGRIIFDFRKYTKDVDIAYEEHIKSTTGGRFLWFGKRKKSVESHTQIQRRYQYLMDKGFIKLDWEENLNDPRIEPIRKAMFDMFINTFTENISPKENFEARSQDPEANNNPQKRKLSANSSYRHFSYNSIQSVENKYQEIRLDNIRLTVTREHQMVANMANVYDHQYNDQCMKTIILDRDPFYNKADMQFVLDQDVDDLFTNKEVNYVTVSVEKKTSSGLYTDDKTINYQDYAKNGRLVTFQYSWDNDQSPSMYRYKIGWSFAGGVTQEEGWKTGSLDAVNLYPSLKPLRVRFRPYNLKAMEEAGLMVAYLRMRYYRLGKEVEEVIEIQVPNGDDRPELDNSKYIFIDRDTRGFLYQVVLQDYHNKYYILPASNPVASGTHWQFSPGGVVGAVLPRELVESDKKRDIMEEVLKKTEDIFLPPPGKKEQQSEARSILEGFGNIIKILSDRR